MSIRPVEFNGMVQRTQDVSTLKQNEDNKPVFEQHVLSGKLQKDVQKSLQQVKHGDDTENYQKKYDAREKGSNEYEGSQSKKKKKENQKEGQVLRKSMYSGFDMKI